MKTYRHLPRRGMADQRQFLLDNGCARYALFIGDDVMLERFVIQRLLEVIHAENCEFAGNALIGLSYLDDIPPQEQRLEFWEGQVQPEKIKPGVPEWDRWHLHNAANGYHLQQRLGLQPGNSRHYLVAWVGGCVMYAVEKLRQVRGFEFWRELPPEHSGEDVLAQLRVMARFGGCGVMPSGVYHQEPTATISDRRIDAPREFEI